MSFLDRYAKQVTSGLWIQAYTDQVAHLALGLTGEAGEIADMIKKSQYDPAKSYSKTDMALELGDVMWYLTNLADKHGYSLTSILAMNISKLENRHPTKGVYSLERLYTSTP